MSDKTICTTCLRLKQGLCDGEKELTACPSYKRMTNADRIRAMTDEELAKMLSTTYDCYWCPINCPMHIKDNQCKDCSDIGLCGNCAVLLALKLLKNVPAADVVEVVRCKDCDTYNRGGCSDGYGVCMAPEFYGSVFPEEFFCKYGRRADNG